MKDNYKQKKIAKIFMPMEASKPVYQVGCICNISSDFKYVLPISLTEYIMIKKQA